MAARQPDYPTDYSKSVPLDLASLPTEERNNSSFVLNLICPLQYILDIGRLYPNILGNIQQGKKDKQEISKNRKRTYLGKETLGKEP